MAGAKDEDDEKREDWFEVMGLSWDATAEEVKDGTWRTRAQSTDKVSTNSHPGRSAHSFFFGGRSLVPGFVVERRRDLSRPQLFRCTVGGQLRCLSSRSQFARAFFSHFTHIHLGMGYKNCRAFAALVSHAIPS